VGAFYTMIEENLRVPFSTQVLGVEVTVEKVDLTGAEEIVAVCRKGTARQRISILELPLPNASPEGTEWIEAYRYWTRGFRRSMPELRGSDHPEGQRQVLPRREGEKPRKATPTEM
jgi:hypothetical protein